MLKHALSALLGAESSVVLLRHFKCGVEISCQAVNDVGRFGELLVQAKSSYRPNVMSFTFLDASKVISLGWAPTLLSTCLKRFGRRRWKGSRGGRPFLDLRAYRP